jgi:hypothetical protein
MSSMQVRAQERSRKRPTTVHAQDDANGADIGNDRVALEEEGSHGAHQDQRSKERQESENGGGDVDSGGAEFGIGRGFGHGHDSWNRGPREAGARWIDVINESIP